MNATTLFNKVTGKTLTRADLDESKSEKGIFYLVVAFPYIDHVMVEKIQSWAVANKYRPQCWSMSAGQFGDQVILSMTLEVLE